MSMKVLLLCVVLFAVSAAAGNDHHHDDHDEDHHCEALLANKTNLTGNSTKEHHHEDHAKIDGLKGGALAIIFTASMIVNSFVIFASVRVSPFWLSIMSSLSGGVMLITGVCHILAEAQEGMQNRYDDDTRERYRPTFVLCCIGYLTMLFLQRALFEDNSHGHAHGTEPKNPLTDLKNPKCEMSDIAATEPKEPPAPQPPIAPAAAVSQLVPSILLLMGFMIHSIAEGMALGLQETEQGVSLIFVAIIMHQWAEDFTYSISTTGQGVFIRIVLSTLEALSCPIGIAIGWGIHEKITPLAVAYILAFTSGTFVYIACTEVVGEALPSGKRSFWQYAAFLLGAGFLYMLLAVLYDPAAHDH